MSFDAYDELLCEKGHLTIVDVFADQPILCPHCNGRFVFSHTVDQTNEIDYDIPGCCPYPFQQIGMEDVWHTDHYGNKYAVPMPIYQNPNADETEIK